MRRVRILFTIIVLIAVASCQKPEAIECWECYKESVENGAITGHKTLYEGCHTESEIFALYPAQTIDAESYIIEYNCKKQ